MLCHVKEIVLPSINDLIYGCGLATCRLSNSLYVWLYASDIWHLVPNGSGGFEVLEWPIYYVPSDDSLDFSAVSYVQEVSALDDGNLLVLRYVFYLDNDEVDNILSIHKPDGSVIRNIKLSYDAENTNITELSNITMQSNGYFVYAQTTDNPSFGCIIREADKDGKAFRNFRYSHEVSPSFNAFKHLFLDTCDRVIFLDGYDKCIFLDCELNFLEILQIKLASEVDWNSVLYADFDKDTNEMVVAYWNNDFLFLKLTL